MAAIREALAKRPEPADKETDGAIVFLQPSGRRWVRNTDKSRTDNLSVQFGELLKKLGLHHDRIGFYTLRHVFRTVADAARDPVAIDLIMGHSDPSMAGHDRERIEDSRLRAVAEHVRQWLFRDTPDADPTGTAPETCDSSDPCDSDESAAGRKDRKGRKKTHPCYRAKRDQRCASTSAKIR